MKVLAILVLTAAVIAVPARRLLPESASLIVLGSGLAVAAAFLSRKRGQKFNS